MAAAAAVPPPSGCVPVLAAPATTILVLPPYHYSGGRLHAQRLLTGCIPDLLLAFAPPRWRFAPTPHTANLWPHGHMQAFSTDCSTDCRTSSPPTPPGGVVDGRGHRPCLQLDFGPCTHGPNMAATHADPPPMGATTVLSRPCRHPCRQGLATTSAGHGRAARPLNANAEEGLADSTCVCKSRVFELIERAVAVRAVCSSTFCLARVGPFCRSSAPCCTTLADFMRPCTERPDFPL